MIKHRLNVGDVIYDVIAGAWGIITHIGDGETTKDFTKDETDAIISYTEAYYDKDTHEWIETQSECQTRACGAYPHVPNRYFQGEMVCEEINRDFFDEFHDYDFYCPSRVENCWDFEVSK